MGSRSSVRKGASAVTRSRSLRRINSQLSRAGIVMKGHLGQRDPGGLGSCAQRRRVKPIPGWSSSFFAVSSHTSVSVSWPIFRPCHGDTRLRAQQRCLTDGWADVVEPFTVFIDHTANMR